MLYKLIKGQIWQEHGSQLLVLDFHNSWHRHALKKYPFKAVNWNEVYNIHIIIKEIIESGVLSEVATELAQSYSDALDSFLKTHQH